MRVFHEVLHHDIQIERLLGVLIENVGDHLGHFEINADLRNQQGKRPFDEGSLVLLLLQHALQPRQTRQLHYLVPVLEEQREVLSGFGSLVRDVDRVDEQQQQQQVGVVVVLLPGDLLDHRPEAFVRHERVHSIRIPQPNADDRVEVRLEGRQHREKATLVCLRLFGKRSPLWWCFLKSSSCAMNWSTNMRKKRLLRSCPNCELSETMSRANQSAMQVA